MLIISKKKKLCPYWSYCVSVFLCVTFWLYVYVLTVTFLCCHCDWPFGCYASAWRKGIKWNYYS